MLFQLSVVPIGSIRTLSLVGYAPQTVSFTFAYASVFDKEQSQWFSTASSSTDNPFASIDAEPPFLSMRMDDLINATTELDLPGNWSNVKVSNIQKAFARNAQLRIFNLANGLTRSFIQVVANFFQVQTVAFLYPVIAFAKEIGVDEQTPPGLLKSYTFATGSATGDPSPAQGVPQLEDLLTRPEAFTAFPRGN
jgi:hypothetical protein